jgi:protein TonB
MSPTLVFPPPFRHRDLPPYGPSDWKRLQPALLRRSLALSSGTALLVGLLLAVLLRQAADLVPDHRNVIILPPVPPPILEPRFPRPSGVMRTPIAKQGEVVVKDRDTTAVQDPIVPPVPGIFDPTATLTTQPSEIPGNAVVAKPAYPDRPDPKVFVALDEFPKEVYSPKPEYPELARQANMEGTVILNVLVNREGRVQEIILVQSSPVFDDAAEQAIRQWRFRPAIMGHEPVGAWVHIPVHFVINGE